MKKIAVVTSGGDAPGMNAAVRAVVRQAEESEIEVFGVRHGYAGLILNELIKLSPRDVSGVIQLGGTFLGTARSAEFKTENAQRKAVSFLKSRNIDALIVIGGGGSQNGAYALFNLGFPVVGVASTIDNDLYGTDICIGTDTALNIIIESIDRIKTTAQSHNRAFLVEVMGRNYGYLPLMAAIAGGAELVVTPEFEMEPEVIAAELKAAYEKGKRYALIIVSDGAKNNAEKISHYFKQHRQHIGYELRVTILGHVQRGGPPTAFDRLLASQLGAAAVEQIRQDNFGMLVGWRRGEVALTPLSEVVSNKKPLDMNMWTLAKILAR